MRHLKALLMVFSFISGCASIPRPNSNLCIVNVPGLRENCLNLKDDYDSLGRIRVGTRFKVKQFSTAEELLNDLNKNTCMDPDSLAELKAFIKKLREEYEAQR